MPHDVRMGHFSLTSNISHAELSALKLEGEVSQHRVLWDQVDDWRTRSAAILRDEKHPLVLTGLSAVWAYGLCPEPLPHTASTVSKDRIRMSENRSLRIEERRLGSEEYWLHGSAGVTHPLRTITDLLRQENFAQNAELSCIPSVMTHFGISKAEVIACLKQLKSVPYKRTALKRAEQLSI
jgi:hypothetical protein